MVDEGDRGLGSELVEFYDDMHDFTEQFAFFADAIPGLCVEGDGPDPSAWAGMLRYGQSLKDRAELLRATARGLQEKAVAAGRVDG